METIIVKMGTRRIETGPTARRVADNIRALRTERRLTLDDLATRLAELGRPILKTGLSKIEVGERRVDVDDLMALAMALEVTPNRLLLTADADDEQQVDLTEGYTTSRAQAWAWACGEWIDGSRFPFTRFTGDRLPLRRFESENRPHRPPRILTAEQWAELRHWQRELDAIFFAMREKGLEPWAFDELKKSGVHYVEGES